MSRYIDADKFKKYILDRYNTMEMVGINQVVNFITEQPTADVEEVVRGKWIEINDYNKCSNCGHEINFFGNYKAKFCLECGADMREE